MEGRDVSEHNGDLSPDWFGQWSFVYVRAFNEHGRIDTHFVQNWDRSRGRTKRGVYGWPIRGADNTNLGRQLLAIGQDAELIPMADYEHSGAGLATVAELETYVRACDGGFYSNLSELQRSSYLDSRPWWFANPSNNRAPRPVALVQYGIVDGVDADRCDDLTPILRGGGGELNEDQNRWLQSIFIRMGGDKGFDGNVLRTVADVVRMSEANVLAAVNALPSKISVGAVDLAAVAKAVNDDAARRLAS